MKDDVEIPAAPPRKRRELEDEGRTLDRWIAIWLAGDTITPSERRRLEAEKARRKAQRPDNPLGLLAGAGGATPEQLAALKDMLAIILPTEIHHPGVSSRVHSACMALKVPVIVHRGGDGPREVVRAAHLVIGTPTTAEPTDSSVWQALRYARHRNLAVRIITPDGSER